MANLGKIIISIFVILHMMNLISGNQKENILFTNKINFPNKSIYFSSLKEGFSSNLNKFLYELEKPHKTDTMIIKIERNIGENYSNTKNFLSLQISNSFFNIMSCVDPEKISYRLKSFLSNFVEISDKMNQCYYTQDYFKFDFNNINSKNQKEKFTSTRNSFYTNIDILNDIKNSDTKISDSNVKIPIEKFLDINLLDYKEAIENFTSDFLMWNENCYFELLFQLDSSNSDIFKLHKIYVYFSYPDQIDHKSYYISLIRNGKDQFDNIFIFHRNSNKIVKFSQKLKLDDSITPIIDITLEDFSDTMKNYTPYISSLRDESLFHNTITIKFDEKLIKNYLHTFKLLTYGNHIANDICFHVFQPLTEDSYIEKNEFKTFLINRHRSVDSSTEILLDASFSKFIDQELPSDQVGQSYLSFIICESFENFRKMNLLLSYPLHLRYQPALTKSEKQTHQSVVMPQPFVQILPKNSTLQMPEIGQTFFEHFFYAGNVFDRNEFYYAVKKSGSKEKSSKGFQIEFDERKLFSEEVEKKLKFNIHFYNTFIFNKDRLVHQVPAGIQRHFILVLIGVVIVTLIGVLFILYALLIYALRERKSKIDLIEKNK